MGGLSGTDWGVFGAAITGTLGIVVGKVFSSPADRQNAIHNLVGELRTEVGDLRTRTRDAEERARTAEFAIIRLISYCERMRDRQAALFHRIDELKERAGVPLTPHEPIPPVPVEIVDGKIVVHDGEQHGKD